MKYSDKLRLIRPFVNLSINNRKNFTTQQKILISKYYNKINGLGYFDNTPEGYLLVSIKGKNAPKIINAPKIEKKYVYVGTVIKNGKAITDPKRKVKFKNRKTIVTQNGAPRIWRFQYNIAREWTEKDFVKHLKKQIGKDGLKKNQHFAIGAGIKYQVGDGNKYQGANAISDKLSIIAKEILKMGHRYVATGNYNASEEFDYSQPYVDRGQKKYLNDWLQEIVVYEYLDDIKARIKNRPLIKKKRKKRK